MKAFLCEYTIDGETGKFPLLSKDDISLSLWGDEPDEDQLSILDQIDCDDYSPTGDDEITISPMDTNNVMEVKLNKS